MEKSTLQPNIEVKTSKHFPTWEDVVGKMGLVWRDKIRPHLNQLTFTLIAMALIFMAAVAADQIQANRALQQAINHPQSFEEFTIMIGNRTSTTGEVIEWPEEYGERALIRFGSPVRPLVYRVDYLRWRGLAKPGDRISFIWREGASKTCPNVLKSGDWFLMACGLQPLQPGQ